MLGLTRRDGYRILRWVKRAAAAYATVMLWQWATAPEHRTAVITGLMVLAQLAFVVAFILIQFVAMFWFLARSREETILPGQAGVVTLSDYWGQPQLLETVRQWVSLLQGVKAFRDMGGLLPNGVLLVGPPGSGKSYLAKCIAGTSSLPFVSMDASSFTNMFMGIGAIKVIRFYRKAKALAREYGGCIVFLDEIDAIAMSRRARHGIGGRLGHWLEKQMMMGGMGGGGGELSTLLYELDGTMERTRFEKLASLVYGLVKKKLPARNWTVFTMAATNVPEVIDPALTRAGRLDRRLAVDAPDRDGRKEILAGYLKKIKRTEDVDTRLDALTDEMQGMTPAQIKMAVLSEAVRKAVFGGHSEVTFKDMQEALKEIQVGLKTPIRDISVDEKKAIAAHEAGHAILVWLLTNHRLTNVTIERYEEALGHVLHHQVKEKYLRSLKDYWHDLIISMGGRAGEIVEFGQPLASVGGDYHHAVHVARVLLEQGVWGTPVSTDEEFSERVKVLFDAGIKEAKRLLGEHRENHTALITALVVRGELGHDEVSEILGERQQVEVPLPASPFPKKWAQIKRKEKKK